MRLISGLFGPSTISPSDCFNNWAKNADPNSTLCSSLCLNTMEIKVTKIVSMTSNVEATVNGLSIDANVRVRNNDTIENVDGGNVKDSTGEQLASFSYYGSNNLNVNYNNIENGNVAAVSTAVNDFIKELEKNPALVSIANTSEI